MISGRVPRMIAMVMVVVAFWMLDNLDDWNRITVFNHEEHKAHKGLAKVNRVLDDLDVLKKLHGPTATHVDENRSLLDSIIISNLDADFVPFVCFVVYIRWFIFVAIRVDLTHDKRFGSSLDYVIEIRHKLSPLRLKGCQ